MRITHRPSRFPGDATQLLVKNGDPLLFTPKWTGTAGISYTWPVRDGIYAYTRTDAQYTGNYDRTYSAGVNGYLPLIRDGQSITTLQLRGGLKSKSGSWDAAAFVNNLTDNSTPLSQDVGTVAGTYGATAIRSISMRPRNRRHCRELSLSMSELSLSISGSQHTVIRRAAKEVNDV